MLSFRLQKYGYKDNVSVKRIETNQISDLQKSNVFTNALFKMSVIFVSNNSIS